jgi:O-antigen/teichoic acid export membrane protein
VGILRGSYLLRRSVTQTKRSGEAAELVGDTNVGLLSMWRFAALAFAGVLAASSVAKLDQVVGLPLIGAQELGLYAVAVSFAELPLAVSAACRAYLIGVRADPTDLGAQQRAVRVVVSGTALGCAIAACVAHPVMMAMFGKEFEGAVGPAIILLCGTAIYSLGASLTGILLALGRVKVQSLALIAGAGVSVVLLIVLRQWGAVGAATASTIGYTLTTVMAFVAVRRGTTGLALSSVLIAKRSDLRRS